MKLLNLGIQSSAEVPVPEFISGAFGPAGPGQLLQFNHQSVAGTDCLVLIVTGTATSNQNIVGASHNDVAMGQVLQDNFAGTGAVLRTGIFFRVAPPIGTFQVQVLWTGTMQNQIVAMMNMRGVDQANPIHLSNTISDAAAGLSLNFNLTRPSLLMGVHAILNASTSVAPDPGTELLDVRVADGGSLLHSRSLLTRGAGFTGSAGIGSTANVAGDGGILSAFALAASD